MTVRYTIEHWFSSTATNANVFETRKRSDAAADLLWKTIRGMIAGNGLLDRPIAWKLKEQFDKCEISSPPIGHYRRERFELNGEYVEFRAERI